MRENEDSRVPVTIEELKDLCTQRGINLYQLGFYLGSDHIGPNAYGIYKDYWTNDFIVYRNIEDGSKTVLYQGQDEKEAVEKISEQLNKVLLNTGAEDTKAPYIDGNSEAEDSPYVSAKNQSPDIESVYSDDDHLDSYADNTSEVDEDQNQEPVRESPSSKDEYNSYTSRPLNGNESFESSWMDIQTPIMRAAANEDVTDEDDEKASDDERSSDKEIEFTGKDVKDLKTGVIFCAGKFFYYLGRLCYYISLIFYYLFRSFDGAGYEINLILTGKRKKVKNRDKDTDTLHSDKEDTIKEAVFEDSDIDSGAGNGKGTMTLVIDHSDLSPGRVPLFLDYLFKLLFLFPLYITPYSFRSFSISVPLIALRSLLRAIFSLNPSFMSVRGLPSRMLTAAFSRSRIS